MTNSEIPLTQRTLAEPDHAIQTRFLDATDGPLRVGIQVRTPRWKFDRLDADAGQHTQELLGKQWIAIMNQVAFAYEQSVNSVSQVSPDLDPSTGRSC